MNLCLFTTKLFLHIIRNNWTKLTLCYLIWMIMSPVCSEMWCTKLWPLTSIFLEMWVPGYDTTIVYSSTVCKLLDVFMKYQCLFLTYKNVPGTQQQFYRFMCYKKLLSSKKQLEQFWKTTLFEEHPMYIPIPCTSHPHTFQCCNLAPVGMCHILVWSLWLGLISERCVALEFKATT